MIENINSNYQAPRDHRGDIDHFGSGHSSAQEYGSGYPPPNATHDTGYQSDLKGSYGREEVHGVPFSRDTMHFANPAGPPYLGSNVEGLGFNYTGRMDSLGQASGVKMSNWSGQSPGQDPRDIIGSKQLMGQNGAEADKERFFESLGLPGNLSRSSVQNFSYLPPRHDR